MINKLINPKKFHEPIFLKDVESSKLREILKRIILIRKTEQKLADERKKKVIGGPVHLSVGQEAIAVGISQNLRKTDRIFGNHRSHSHLMAVNPNFYKLFAEVLGKKTGFSKGMGGSMHLFDKESGFYGSTPIVAGTVSLAVGAGLASKMQGLDDIAVSYFGDGAVEEGVVHESFNLSKILNTPVLFVIENNLFASHMHISLRQTKPLISRFAVANDIPYELLDGNDVLSVMSKSKELINTIRQNKSPAILEAITYRWYGHVDWREDIDVGVERSMADVQNWKLRDPLNRLSKSMIDNNIWTQKEEDELVREIDQEIEKAWQKALKDPHPSSHFYLRNVLS